MASQLLNILREQKEMGLKGGIYHKTQIDLTYNSNHIEGSKLTHEQTRYIYETNTIGITDEAVKVYTELADLEKADDWSRLAKTRLISISK